MRKIFLLLPVIFLAACASSPSVQLYEGRVRADSDILTVRVPSELEIISINDRRISGAGTMFAYGYRDLKLMPGQYRIVAYYKNVFQLSADEHEVVKSDPALFTLNGHAGDLYSLEFDRPADVEAARELAKDFEGWAENAAKGERIASVPSGLVRSGGFIGITTATQAEAPPASAVAPDSAGSDAVSADALLDTMKQNWTQATPEQRKEFLLWMSQ